MDTSKVAVGVPDSDRGPQVVARGVAASDRGGERPPLLQQFRRGVVGHLLDVCRRPFRLPLRVLGFVHGQSSAESGSPLGSVGAGLSPSSKGYHDCLAS